MTATLETVEKDALGLPTEARAFLADRLLSSLGDDIMTEFDAAWVAEAERRYEEYKAGTKKPVPASDVFAQADRMLE